MHMRQQSAEAVEHTRTVEPKLVGHFEQTLQVGRLIFFENVVDDEKATINPIKYVSNTAVCRRTVQVTYIICCL